MLTMNGILNAIHPAMVLDDGVKTTPVNTVLHNSDDAFLQQQVEWRESAIYLAGYKEPMYRVVNT